jgi:DNA-binding LacI/PurR family transcriptional regulator
MAEVTNPFYARVLDVLSRILQERGLTLLLFTASDAHLIDDLIPTLLAYQVDGVVIASATLSSSLARRCREAGTPVVLFNRYTQKGHVNAVSCDNIAGGRLAARLLLDSRPERIGFIAGIEDTSSSQDRERGFMEEITRDLVPRIVRAVGHYTYEGGRDAARKLLEGPERPDALFCANDVMALGAIDVARGEFGLNVPDDLSVIGFDDIPTAALDAYALTTVVQDVEAMARETIDLLLESRINPDLPPQKRLVPCRIALRRSVRRPAH